MNPNYESNFPIQIRKRSKTSKSPNKPNDIENDSTTAKMKFRNQRFSNMMTISLLMTLALITVVLSVIAIVISVSNSSSSPLLLDQDAITILYQTFFDVHEVWINGTLISSLFEIEARNVIPRNTKETKSVIPKISKNINPPNTEDVLVRYPYQSFFDNRVNINYGLHIDCGYFQWNNYTFQYAEDLFNETSQYYSTYYPRMNWKSQWVSDVIYQNQNVVTHMGSTYVCIESHFSNSTNTPEIGEFSSIYWESLSSTSVGNATSSFLLNTEAPYNSIARIKGSYIDGSFIIIDDFGNLNLNGTINGIDINDFYTAFMLHVNNLDIHRELDDGIISSITLWSSQKINNELNTKAPLVHTHTSSDISDFESRTLTIINSTKGVPNGIASLGPDGKIPASQIAFDGLYYQGAWDASSNTPTLSSGVGVLGDFYIVNVAGTTNIDGYDQWHVGDWIIFNGVSWEKSDNSESVISVAGKIGIVLLDAADITSGTFADSRISSSSVTQYENLINHDNLAGFVANEHVDHSMIYINTIEGITGGSNILTSMMLKLDIDSLPREASPDEMYDVLLMYDNSTNLHKKIRICDVPFVHNILFSTDHSIVRWDGNSGRKVQNSNVIIDDSGNIVTPGTVDGVDVSDLYTSTQTHISDTNNPHSVTKEQIGLSDVLNIKSNYDAVLAPTSEDDVTPAGYQVGSRWINTVTRKEYICLDNTNGAAVWKETTILGMINDAVNVGTEGISVYEQNTGETLEFRSINSGSSKVSVSYNSSNKTINIDVNTSQLDHDTLQNYVSNEHIDHSTVQVVAGEGLQGGGDLTSNINLSLNYNGLDVASNINILEDYVTIYDGSENTHKKVLLDSFEYAYVSSMAATDNAIVRFDGSSKKHIQDSDVLIDDMGNIVLNGTVDGIDVSDLSTTTNAHIADTNNPHSVTKAQLGLSNVPNIKHNLAATTDPDNTNDDSEDYSEGSIWINTANNAVWVCVDSTTTTAVWDRLDLHTNSITNTELANNAVQTSNVDTGAITSDKIADNTIAEIDMSLPYKRGVANGVATLGGDGKVPASQLDIDALSYQGTWDASTNTPTITSSVGTQGHFYIVSVTGTTNIDGMSDWTDGDWILFSGSVWEKADNTDSVFSVNGYTGTIVLDTGDITENSNLYYTEARVSSNTDVSANSAHRIATNNPHAVTKAQVGLSNVQNIKNNYVATVAPSVNDDAANGYSVGSIWVDVTNDKSYICIDSTNSAALWTEMTQQDTGESNTASNGGVGGIGWFKQKNGITLEFKNINSGDSKIVITDDAMNDEVDLSIASNAITTTELANDAVTSDKLAINAVTNTKLIDNAVTSSKIMDDAITSQKLASNLAFTGYIQLMDLMSSPANPGATKGVLYKKSGSPGIWWKADAAEPEIDLSDHMTDHGLLSGLLDDDHTQYALLNGRAGGQTLIGGTNANDKLILTSTSHATKGPVEVNGILNAKNRVVANDQGYVTTYSLSVQDGTIYSYIEILNNRGAGKGAFFGLEEDTFALYNWQGGDIVFWTDTTASSGVDRFTIGANGNIRIHNLAVGVVKSAADGTLSSETINTAFNKNFGTTAGTVSEGNHNHPATDTHIADDSLHRTINDMGLSTTDLWSANKISAELSGKANLIHTHTSASITDFDTAVDGRITLQKGNANGIATLDSGGKIPASQLDLDSVDYQGTWDASTNTPTLTSSSCSKGNYYVVSVTGSTNLDGITDWVSGDWVICSFDNVWQKADHTDSVSSVAGKTGAVTLVAADILSGTFSNARISQSSVTQHEGAINHNNILNVGSYTHTQIDNHINDATLHRTINDAGSSTTDLWSASKIMTELASLTSGDPVYAYARSDTTSVLTTSVTTTWTKVGLAVTTLIQSGDFSLTVTNGEVQYTGTVSKQFKIDFDVSIDSLTSGYEWYFAINVNNAATPPGPYMFLSIDTAGKAQSLSISKTITLNQNDVVSFWGRSTSGTRNVRTLGYAWNIIALAKDGLDGAQGIQGEPGPAGSGSTINLKDEGTSIPNSPHSILNFVGEGVTVTDAGAGQATITIDNTPSYGEFYFATQTPVAVVGSGIAMTKIAVTTTFGSLSNNFDQPSNGRLRYTGTTTKVFRVSYDLVANVGSDRTIKIQCYKNASPLANFLSYSYVASNTKEEYNGMTGLVQLAQNDYIEIYIENIENSDDIFVMTYKLVATSL